ncbi:MAG: Stp1/IreP family PP2C-type Ser/Thr phosphatase [Firmicutes bacterium]|nr:Stp1/IreP family PP2C-type Ser/Thr phosphatase [Bacillota bacterium]
MLAEARSEVGLVRPNNEDAYLICLNRGLFVVADGMGGHEAGEVASRLAIDEINRKVILPACRVAPAQTLHQGIQAANQRVFEFAQTNPMCNGMGTTVTAALLVDRTIYIAHVGDSRAYLVRPDGLRLLTQDHSLVGELVRNGELTESAAMFHPFRHVLTRALGTKSEIEVDSNEVFVQPGDLLLLCTDGLSNLINDREIHEIIRSAVDLKAAINELTKLSLERGGYDNITIVIVQLD